MKTHDIKEHPAFRGISEKGLQVLLAACSLRTYSVGQLLSTSAAIPPEVLVILEGEARLLFRDNGRLRTVEKLQPSALVGLCSILRVSPCEEVSAASNVTAITIPYRSVLHLLETEESFSKWSQLNIFSAELIYLLDALCASHPLAERSTLKLLPSFITASRTLTIECNKIEAAFWPDSKETIFCASNNVPEAPLYSIISGDFGDIKANPPLPPRIIAVSSDWIKSNLQLGKPFSKKDSSTSLLDCMDPLPASTSQDLGGIDGRQPKLLRAKGYREEVLHCFKMVSELMQVSYKKDAIWQIVDDILSHEDKVDLKECGNIAATLGLHASGVKVSSTQCTRLAVPAIIPWNGGIGVLTKSNSQGITIASPKEDRKSVV